MRVFRKNQVNPARNSRLTPAPASCTGGSITGPRNSGSSLTGSGMRAYAGAEHQRGDAADQRGEPDRRHDDRDDRPAEQLAQHHALQPEAECDHAGERERGRQPEGQARAQGRRGNDCGQHDEFALGEVDRVGRLVDQHEPQRDQRIHQSDHQPAGDQQQREIQIEFRHAPVPTRRSPLRPPPRSPR